MRKNGDNDDESLKTLSDTTMVYGGVDLRKKGKNVRTCRLTPFLACEKITLLSINQIYDVPVITLLSITVKMYWYCSHYKSILSHHALINTATYV